MFNVWKSCFGFDLALSNMCLRHLKFSDCNFQFKKIGYPTRAHLWNRKANQFCHSMMPSDLEVNGNYRFSQQVQISNVRIA